MVLTPTAIRFVRQLGKLLGALNDQDVARLQQAMHEQQLATRESVYCAGDQDDRIAIVVSGRLKLYVPAANGKEVILALAGAGDLVGETALVEGGVRQSSAEALEPSTVLSLCRAEFEALMQQRPAFACAVARLLAGRLLLQQTQLQRLIAQPVASRLAALLQDELRHAGSGCELRLTLTHQEVAQRIGTSRETVTALLSRFVTLGMLSHRGRQITIHDPGQLAACARGSIKVSPRLPLAGSPRHALLARSA